MIDDAKRPGPPVVIRGSECPGCGAVIADPGGRKQAPTGSSPGCWAAYGDLVGREYGEWSNPPIHRLTSATYAAQHPGEPTAQGIQAAAVHLITLLFTVERGIDAARVPREIGRAVADPSLFRWLEPPEEPDWWTILDVRGARDVRDHTARVQRWAGSVWQAWGPHHATIRKWAGR